MWDFSTTQEDSIEACKYDLISTKAKFCVYLDELAEETVDRVTAHSVEKKYSDRRKVFVVHGHNGELKQSVARLVERQGLEAVILSERANLGNTIIEKFERNSDVGAAICLFTEDDEWNDVAGTIMYRARQNVVFEAGYFIGRLGRKNVIILANNRIEIPSDLSGVVYANNRLWELQVLKELDAMGFEIDFSKIP